MYTYEVVQREEGEPVRIILRDGERVEGVVETEGLEQAHVIGSKMVRRWRNIVWARPDGRRWGYE